jgi:hypothetical protein
MIPVGMVKDPECPQGYTREEIEEIFEHDEKDLDDFWHWMVGQTMSVCDGRRYDHEARDYEPTECADNTHGVVTYSWDVKRYLQNKLNNVPLIWD